jgi:hypothetical protein
MVVLLCFFLALLTSPFKSKSRLESRECRAPTSADRAAAQGARSRPPHEQRSPVLHPAVSLVSVGAPSRSARNLLRCGISTTLELDVGMTKDGVLVVHHDERLSPDITRGPDGAFLTRHQPRSHWQPQTSLRPGLSFCRDVRHVELGMRLVPLPDQEPAPLVVVQRSGPSERPPSGAK